jgi:benzylsuccinate CoA-transferase BbsE subunit
METQNTKEYALGDIRVLDLTGPSGLYCTKLLSDLGADVIRIERPGGDSIRRLGPFYNDEPHPEKSLYHFHFNTNKRSITLDIDSEEGRRILKRLVATADIMVETFAPGHLASMGLDYTQLKQINPQIILVSITGFGQTGPYKDYNASDLTGLAVGGVLYTMGFPEDPPTSLGGSQAYHMASANAAIGALMALHNRDMGGGGQWVDVPIQGTVLRMSEMAPFTYWIKGTSRGRTGIEYYRSLRTNFPCKDGYVVCSALGGAGADRMLEWMESEDLAADLKNEKYDEVVSLMKKATVGDAATRRLAQEFKKEVDHIEEVWQAFLMTHTREELFVGAQTRGVKLFPLNDAKSVVEDIGLKERNYFVEVHHPELGRSLKYPGPPYRFSETPWEISRRAPLIGEHNIEIYEKELGISRDQLAVLKTANVI